MGIRFWHLPIEQSRDHLLPERPVQRAIWVIRAVKVNNLCLSGFDVGEGMCEAPSISVAPS